MNYRQFYRAYPQIRQSVIGEFSDAPELEPIRQSVIGESAAPAISAPPVRKCEQLQALVEAERARFEKTFSQTHAPRRRLRHAPKTGGKK